MYLQINLGILLKGNVPSRNMFVLIRDDRNIVSGFGYDTLSRDDLQVHVCHHISIVISLSEQNPCFRFNAHIFPVGVSAQHNIHIFQSLNDGENRSCYVGATLVIQCFCFGAPALMKQNDNRLGTLLLEIGCIGVDDGDFICKDKVVGATCCFRRVAQRHSDKSNPEVSELFQKGRRKQGLLCLIVNHIGGQILKFCSWKLIVQDTGVSANFFSGCATTMLDAFEFLLALVKLVIANHRHLHPQLPENVDGCLILSK